MTAAIRKFPIVNEYERRRALAKEIIKFGPTRCDATVDGVMSRPFNCYADEKSIVGWINENPTAKVSCDGEPLAGSSLQEPPEPTPAPVEPPPVAAPKVEAPKDIPAKAEVAPEPAKPAPQASGVRKPSLIMVRASDIEPEKISWLWPNRIAQGKLTLIAGNAGLGKSQLTVHLAAQVSTGGRWPNAEGVAPLGSVIILSCEDDVADTVVPRLIAAGADRSKIRIIEAVKIPVGNGSQEKHFNIANDVQALCDAIDEIGDVRMIIIDPITAYLGTGRDVDSHKNAEVRAALAPLQSRAAKLGFAAVVVTHLNKGGGTEALGRVIGSTAFGAVARAAFLVVGDTETERTLFLAMKNNIGRRQSGLAFRVVSKLIGGDIETSAIEWDADEVTTSADEALAAAAGRGGDKDRDTSSVAEAMNFLRDVLSEGAVAAKTVQHQAKEAGISKATLRRAQKAMGVKARHRGDGGSAGRGEWVWEMPEQITLRRTDIDG